MWRSRNTVAADSAQLIRRAIILCIRERCAELSIFFQTWMAFGTIHRPLFTESKNVYFPNDGSLSTSYNGAFCKVGQC